MNTLDERDEDLQLSHGLRALIRVSLNLIGSLESADCSSSISDISRVLEPSIPRDFRLGRRAVDETGEADDCAEKSR